MCVCSCLLSSSPFTFPPSTSISQSPSLSPSFTSQDTTPELLETFFVQLISVRLLDQFNDTSPPFIGPVATVTINILPNDSPQGEFVLEQGTLSLPEGNTNLTLRVLRQAGTFGDVSVSVSPLLTTATIDVDFSFQNIVRISGK